MRCRLGFHDWTAWTMTTHEVPLYQVIHSDRTKLGYAYVRCTAPTKRECRRCPAIEQRKDNT